MIDPYSYREKYDLPKKFESSRLGISAKAKFSVDVAYPEKGFKAFMVMLKYKHPTIPGATYNITTRMFTASPDELFEEVFVPWTFYIETMINF